MDDPRMVTVILTRGLLEQLRRRAEQERIPVSWLVAGRLCRTMIDVAMWRRTTWGVPDAAIGPIPSDRAWN